MCTDQRERLLPPELEPDERDPPLELPLDLEVPLEPELREGGE